MNPIKTYTVFYISLLKPGANNLLPRQIVAIVPLAEINRKQE
jgi:hypothetical protein